MSNYFSSRQKWNKLIVVRRIDMLPARTRKIRIITKKKSIRIDYGQATSSKFTIGGKFKYTKASETIGPVESASFRFGHTPKRFILKIFENGTCNIGYESDYAYNIRNAFYLEGGYSLECETDTYDELMMLCDGENHATGFKVDGKPRCACSDLYYWFDETCTTISDVKSLIDFKADDDKAELERRCDNPLPLRQPKVDTDINNWVEDELVENPHRAVVEYYKSRAAVFDILGHHHEYRVKGIDPDNYVLTDQEKWTFGISKDTVYLKDAKITYTMLDYFEKMYDVVARYEPRKTWLHKKYPNYKVYDRIKTATDEAMNTYHMSDGIDFAIKDYLKMV
jgi:hypothetical protein